MTGMTPGGLSYSRVPILPFSLFPWLVEEEHVPSLSPLASLGGVLPPSWQSLFMEKICKWAVSEQTMP